MMLAQGWSDAGTAWNIFPGEASPGPWVMRFGVTQEQGRAAELGHSRAGSVSQHRGDQPHPSQIRGHPQGTPKNLGCPWGEEGACGGHSSPGMEYGIVKAGKDLPAHQIQPAAPPWSLSPSRATSRISNSSRAGGSTSQFQGFTTCSTKRFSCDPT